MKMLLLVLWYYNMSLILNSNKLKPTSKTITMIVMATFSFCVIGL